MKKLFVSILVVLAFAMNAIANGPQLLTPISFTVEIIKKGGLVNPFPKSPDQTPEPPEASIDGHTLYLYDVDYDLTLSLLDEYSEEVYTVFIPANTTSVVLPSTLTGEFELQLFTDGIYYFVGTIEL